MRSRVLVVGGTGLLGRAIVRRLGTSCVATGLSRAAVDTFPLDAVDANAVRRVVSTVEPEVVVNLVAERRPARWADSSHLYEANVVTARNVAEAARGIGADLVHLSTDYVFASGGPHRADAPHAPTNAYGVTKSEAEGVVRHAHEYATILRMPILYGPVERPDECNLSELVHRLALTDVPVELDSWARRRPTHVDDVAETLARMLGAMGYWRSRAVHVSAAGWYSQFDMGQLAIGLIGRDPSLVVAVSKETSDRPRLVNLDLDGSTPFLDHYRSLPSGLAELVEGYAEQR